MIKLWLVGWDSNGFWLSAVIAAEDRAALDGFMRWNNCVLAEMEVQKIGIACDDVKPGIIVEQSL